MSGTSDKEQSCQSGDVKNAGLIPGLREDPLEEGMATYSSILAWRISMDRGAWWAISHRVAKSWTCSKWLSMHAHIDLNKVIIVLCSKYQWKNGDLHKGKPLDFLICLEHYPNDGISNFFWHSCCSIGSVYVRWSEFDATIFRVFYPLILFFCSKSF